MFDLKKEKWFIRTPTPEISKVVQEWLFEQGLERAGLFATKQVQYWSSEAIGHGYTENGRFGHTPINWWLEKGYKEIKLTFKTIVDSVEYPETVTPEHQQLAAVMEKLNQLQSEAEQLQAIINKGKV